MQFTLPPNDLCRYTQLQLDHFFPDRKTGDDIRRYMGTALERIDFCFSKVHTKYFKQDGQTCFNHLHGDQYAMYLYFLSNTIHRNGGDARICEKLFYLNKIMNGIDVFYTVQLPDIFLFSHPLGSVLGRATYGNYLVIHQNCTIGGNHNNGAVADYPVLGEFLEVYQGASILGKSDVGDHCKISAHSLVLNQDVPRDRIYIGKPDNFILKTNRGHHHVWQAKGLDIKERQNGLVA